MTKKTILLVDDEDIILLGTSRNLEKAGYEVVTASSGEEAIEKLEKCSSYDLVITDLNLGGKTGLDVLIKAREINVNMCLMVTTGFGVESPLFKQAYRLKLCAHAFKPFPKKELLEKVGICLEKPS
jgi:DNA-binding NtrC family response regulator